jgi:hypothetical protein
MFETETRRLQKELDKLHLEKKALGAVATADKEFKKLQLDKKTQKALRNAEKEFKKLHLDKKVQDAAGNAGDFVKGLQLEKVAAEKLPPQLVEFINKSDYIPVNLPTKKRGGFLSKLVLLAVIGGIVYFVWKQMQANNTPQNQGVTVDTTKREEKAADAKPSAQMGATESDVESIKPPMTGEAPADASSDVQNAKKTGGTRGKRQSGSEDDADADLIDPRSELTPG